MDRSRDGLVKIIARIFVIAFFFVMLFFSCVVISLKSGIMKGKDIDDMLDNVEAYDYLEGGFREIVEIYVDKNLSDGGELVKCVPQGLIKDSVKEMVGALSKERDIDIYEVTSYKEEFVENICTYTLDLIAAEIEKDGQITKDTIRRCEIISEIDKTLNTELEKSLCDEVDNYQGKLDFRDSLPPELRIEIVEDISMVINPVMDIFVDEYIQDVNAGINQEIEGTGLRETFGDINDCIVIIRKFFAVVIIITVIAGFIIFMLYKDKRYKAFSHVGRCFAIIGMIGIMVAVIGSVAKSKIYDALTEVLVEMMGRNIESAGAFAENIIKTFINPTYVISSLYIFVGIVCIVIGFREKIKNRK